MKVAIIFICVFSALLAYCGGDILGRRFSLVSLPFKYHKIVPDFIDEAPRELLQVKWPRAEARLGNVLSISRVNSKPKFIWDCDPDLWYTLLAVDLEPLGPHNPRLSELRYWAVGNIHKCNFNTGEVINDYLAPTPIYGSGQHRFVYLLYKRRSKMLFEEPFVTGSQVEGRLYTSIQKFAVKYDLGRPCAGNFYLLEYDSTFPVNYAKLDQPFPPYVLRAIEESDLPEAPTAPAGIP